MPLRIEDYALIGDCQTAALVGNDGSIDWLCLPRFDSGACFAALLGGPEHGRWLLAPRVPVKRVDRTYRDGSLILDTTFETDGAEVTVTDCMPMRDAVPHVIRIVRGVRGRMPMRTELVVRFDYGLIVPWVRKAKGGGIRAIAGPDSIALQSDVPLRGENLTTVAEFDVAPGDVVSLVLTWHPSHVKAPHEIDPIAVVDGTERAWREWSAQSTYRGPSRGIVERSLVTLKALTHTTTGGIVAAPTTSLPEAIGGPRNWDYRYGWVRDATFTLLALLHSGFREEACSWREWLLRAVAGDPSKLQIMYAVDGRRRLDEQEIPWLPGYEGSAPVRVGNAAFQQNQLDVYGEIMDALHQCHTHGVPAEEDAWNLRLAMLEFLETCWNKPDEGIWEVRGPARQFTHSKVMAWVAFDRAVRGLDVERRRRGQGAARAMAGPARSHASRDLRARLQLRPRRVRPSVRRQGARREPSHDAARRLSPAHRRARSRDGAGDRSSPSRGRLRAPLRERPARRRPSRGRGRVSPVQLLARRQLGAHGSRRPMLRRSSSAWSPSATTWGCSPRSTTCPGDGWSATSRRPSRMCR